MFSFWLNSFNLIPTFFLCSLVFPAFLDKYGNKYSLLSLVATFLFSKILHDTNEEGDTSLCASWLQLISLTSRLAIACCGLGLLLTEYHGLEDVAYHLFPAIPWLMPITISLVLTALVALGLQPSQSLRLSFHILFITLISIFIILGFYAIMSVDKELVLSIKLDRIDQVPLGVIFFLQPFIVHKNDDRYNKRISTSAFLLILILNAILSTFNEKVKCNGIISCTKTLHHWFEPFTLALTIGSLGLILPDIFMAAQNFLDETHKLKKILISIEPRFNSTIVIGLICTGLVYLCSLTNLIMISGASLLLQLSLEKSLMLLKMSNNEDSFNNFIDLSSPEGSDLEEGNDLEDSVKTSDEFSNDLSDTVSNCSDISLIVAEYKERIKFMNGDADYRESSMKRIMYLTYGLMIIISIIGLFLPHSFQNKQLITSIITVLGLNSFIFLHQWITSKYLNSPESLHTNGLKAMYSYILCLLVLGSLPNIVLFYLMICTAKGLIIYIIYKHRDKINGKVKVRQMVSIKESPPVFETTCGICEPKSSNLYKF